MASVLNSKARYYRSNSQENTETERRIESEADIFIKELSHKQLRTSFTLDEQLSQGRKFQSSHSYQPITAQTSGTSTYDEFKLISTAVEHQTDKVTDSNEIETRNVSRHIRELARAVKPTSTETKLLEFAITCNAVGSIKPDNRSKDHPINYLQDLDKELFGYLTESGDPEKAVKTALRKRKQLLEATSDPVEVKSKPNPASGTSLWDVDELPSPSKKMLPEKCHSCQKEKLFTIKNGQIVCLNDAALEQEQVYESTTIEKSNIRAAEVPTRISKDKIKNLRQFKDYRKGEPAKTLYLKNLSPHVKEEDISAWFSEFQSTDKPQIVYNLMKSGKMRDQAFIHFSCIDDASKALEKLNGCIVYEKPLIIQFSNKSQR